MNDNSTSSRPVPFMLMLLIVCSRIWSGCLAFAFIFHFITSFQPRWDYRSLLMLMGPAAVTDGTVTEYGDTHILVGTDRKPLYWTTYTYTASDGMFRSGRSYTAGRHGNTDERVIVEYSRFNASYARIRGMQATENDGFLLVLAIFLGFPLLLLILAPAIHLLFRLRLLRYGRVTVGTLLDQTYLGNQRRGIFEDSGKTLLTFQYQDANGETHLVYGHTNSPERAVTVMPAQTDVATATPSTHTRTLVLYDPTHSSRAIVPTCLPVPAWLDEEGTWHYQAPAASYLALLVVIITFSIPFSHDGIAIGSNR